MKLKDRLKNFALSFLGLEKLSENPNSRRYMFINDDDAIRLDRVREYKTWFIGNSDELLNFYTGENAGGFSANVMYNRNRMNYFWAIAAGEGAITRVHSGFPYAMIQTMDAIVGMPQIKASNIEQDVILQHILEENDFTQLLTQQQRPMTMVEGDGAYKIVIDTTISDEPIIQYYEYEDVDYKYVGNKLVGIIFRDYYQYDKKDYVLLDRRELINGESVISYELLRLEPNNETVTVDISTIPELAHLKNKTYHGLNSVLGVVCKYLYDPIRKTRGRSYFEGQIDKFDALDQVLSQGNLTIRYSTPVEYYHPDILERDKQGNIKLPKLYNRQFIQKISAPNGDGEMGNTDIQTTQPDLNTQQYIEMARFLIDSIVIGFASMSSFGENISKKDNAEAQREKEKATIMTRDNIMDREGKQIKSLCEMLLVAHKLMREEEGEMHDDPRIDCDITVKYDEFANPSFEQQIQTLGNAYNAGIISPERLIETLYGDKLSEEDKQKEIEYIKGKEEQDNLSMMGMEDYGLEGSRNNLQEQENSNNEFAEIER